MNLNSIDADADADAVAAGKALRICFLIAKALFLSKNIKSLSHVVSVCSAELGLGIHGQDD